MSCQQRFSPPGVRAPALARRRKLSACGCASREPHRPPARESGCRTQTASPRMPYAARFRRARPQRHRPGGPVSPAVERSITDGASALRASCAHTTAVEARTLAQAQRCVGHAHPPSAARARTSRFGRGLARAPSSRAAPFEACTTAHGVQRTDGRADLRCAGARGRVRAPVRMSRASVFRGGRCLGRGVPIGPRDGGGAGGRADADDLEIRGAQGDRTRDLGGHIADVIARSGRREEWKRGSRCAASRGPWEHARRGSGRCVRGGGPWGGDDVADVLWGSRVGRCCPGATRPAISVRPSLVWQRQAEHEGPLQQPPAQN